MTVQTRPIKSWDRFITRHFRVDADVLGMCHEFANQGASVRLLLPTLEQAEERDGKASDVAYIDTRRSSDNSPVAATGKSVDIIASLGSSFPLPLAALSTPPNAWDLFSNEQQQALEYNVQTHTKYAINAFVYWVRIMRWASDCHLFARSFAGGVSSGDGPYLLDAETNHRIWAAGRVFGSGSYCRIDILQWKRAQEALNANYQPLAYVELRHDAESLIYAGDYKLALVDLAIACEMYIRSFVISRSPAGLHQVLMRSLEEQLSIRTILDKIFPDYLEKTGKRQLEQVRPSVLDELLDVRNMLVHMGSTDLVTKEKCQKFLNAVRKLHAIGNN